MCWTKGWPQERMGVGSHGNPLTGAPLFTGALPEGLQNLRDLGTQLLASDTPPSQPPHCSLKSTL